MELEIARFVLSDEGRAELAQLGEQPAALETGQHLATLTLLRRRLSPERAAGLLEVAVARLRAQQQGKFSRAAEMFFTKSGLAQSSGEIISQHRADRLANILPPDSRVADLGCGIGGDSLGLARHFRVSGLDLDPARLLFATANAVVYGLADRFEPRQADITEFDPSGQAALFFDPARRTAEGRRLFSVKDYSPPLSLIKSWLWQLPNLGVKISPGVDYRELSEYECEIEIISENGDVKEAVLWFGGLRTKGVSRRATLLPTADTLTDLPGHPPVGIGPPLAYLYEPDGAVIRAGLVEELALALDARKLEPDIAYLTAAALVITPFARAYRVLESQPFNLKKLNHRLNELEIGRVTVKKRGSPLEPAQLEQALKLKGTAHLFIVLTQVEGVHTAILCEPT